MTSRFAIPAENFRYNVQHNDSRWSFQREIIVVNRLAPSGSSRLRFGHRQGGSEHLSYNERVLRVPKREQLSRRRKDIEPLRRTLKKLPGALYQLCEQPAFCAMQPAMDMLIDRNRYEPRREKSSDLRISRDRRTVDHTVVAGAPQWVPASNDHCEQLVLSGGNPDRLRQGDVPRNV